MPLSADDITAAGTFEPVDPAREVLAGLMAAAIRGELGTGPGSAWRAVTATLPTGHRLAASTDPVGTIWRDDPSATALRQVKVGSWPLLAVCPDGAAEYEQITTMKAAVKQRWLVMWCLGDYEADLALKLSPVLSAVSKVMAETICAGRHPNYESGTRQFGPGRGDLSVVRPLTYEAGAARFSDGEDSRFWSASLTLETVEMARDLDVGEESSGLVVTAATGNEVELLPEFVTGDGDFPG